MSGTYGSQAEAELALETLLDHHQMWLMQQPELLILWTQPRAVRKAIAKLLSEELLTIPVRGFDENTLPNRQMRRRILAEVRRTDPDFWKNITR